MKTKQQILEQVTKHLLTQNKRAHLPTGGYAYRSPEGYACAIGCLIPDEHYDPEIEGVPVDAALEPVKSVYYTERAYKLRKALELSGIKVTKDNVEFLKELQRIHDIIDPDRWKHHLKNVAISIALERRVTK